MEKSKLEIGDYARHLHFNKSTNLLVLNTNDTVAIVRYAHGGVFYTQEFFLYEVEKYDVTKANARLTF